ncbi:MAG: histidine--tRNA ligase [Pseudobdellovibrionaceae bacterium]
MKIQPVRGTQDLQGQSVLLYRHIENLAKDLTALYGYEEIKTPIFEFTDVFHRTLGETSDVVHKETYTFSDRSGDSLTLRPEGTAGIARSFISEGLAQNLPLKFYYSGPMFRHERPQKGRYRQFHQIGVECLGLDSAYADIESIAMAFRFLEKLGITPSCQLEINTLGDQASRQKYREVLVDYFSKFKNDLSADSQVRLEKNPLRILDSKDPKDQTIAAGAPKATLSENSLRFFTDVQEGLSLLDIPFKLNANLVRGLDYYTHTVFEITTTQLGSQGTVLAGGRYDGLIEMMGGPATPGFGWAAGIERLSELVAQNFTEKKPLQIAVIAADAAGEKKALQVCEVLRKNNYTCENILSGSGVGKKMKRANKIEARYAVVLGATEVATNVLTVKNLQTGQQESTTMDVFLDVLAKA